MSWLKKLDLIGWIKNKLRPVKEIRVVEPGVEFKQFMRFIDKAARERMNKLEAENARLRGKLGEADELERRKEQIHEARKEALAQADVKKRTLALKLCVNDGRKTVDIPRDRLPLFFYRKGKHPHKSLRGFFLKENASGGLEFMPWLVSGSGVTMFRAGSPTFKDFFANNAYIASQLMGGKADTNFMLDEDDNPHFKGNPNTRTKDEEISILEGDLAKHRSTISQLDDALKKSQRRESFLQSRIANLQGKLRSRSDLASTMTASSRELHHEMAGYAKEVADAARAASGLQVSHAVSDENMNVLQQSLESIRSKLQDKKSKRARDEALADLKSMQKYLTKMDVARAKSQQLAQMMPPQEKPPAKPPAEK